MTPQDLERLWSDPNHWTAWGYRCPADPRVIVPKRVKALGWTINWAHPRAWPMLFAFLALAVGPAIATMAVLIAIGATDPDVMVPAFTVAMLVSTAAIIGLAFRIARA